MTKMYLKENTKVMKYIKKKYNRDIHLIYGGGVNLNNIERTIIELVLKDPTLTAEKISIEIGKTKRTAERYLKSLQDKAI